MSRIKKILLPQMADVRADFSREFQMVVDDEADVCAARDRQDFFRHAPDVIGRRIFGAQLDQVAAAVAKLLRDEFRRAAMQIGRVHERVKFAIRERFHPEILTTKHTKHTKEFGGGQTVGTSQCRLCDLSNRSFCEVGSGLIESIFKFLQAYQ